MVAIKRGLNIPIQGQPEQRIDSAPPASRVALVGDDYLGMKPTMLVQPGDRVRLGQPVFSDKKSEGVEYTAPASGTVVAVNRGAKRKFESLVIEVEGDEAVSFPAHGGEGVGSLSRDAVVETLVSSGQWTALRMRPFGKVPSPCSEAPRSIFVQAIDTNPLAADPSVVLADRKEMFTLGLIVLTRLTPGTVFVCKAPKADIPGEGIDRVRVEEFSGPHPAGLVGTHIHFLDPVGPGRTVWYLGYQDVAAIGTLFETGQLDTRRVVAFGGPRVERPRLLETRIGADLDALTAGELIEDPSGQVANRIISGSVLCGRKAADPVAFLGRYHNQVSVLAEGTMRELFGWQKPGFDKFSVTRVFASSLLRDRQFDLTTSTEGSERAMVPIGTYERVMPLDILATQLLRSLIVRDTEQAQMLGALELEEEDLGLCTFVCPGKYDYDLILRDNLNQIEREG